MKAEGDEPFDERETIDAVWRMVYQLFGEFGASQVGLSLVKTDIEDEVLIIRCSHKGLDNVRAAIAAATEISNQRAVIRVLAVSGTLKALRKKLPMQIT